MEVDNSTKFILSIQRKVSLQYYTPINVWAEINEDNHTQFRFCARGDDNFASPQSDVKIVSRYQKL